MFRYKLTVKSLNDVEYIVEMKTPLYNADVDAILGGDDTNVIKYRGPRLITYTVNVEEIKEHEDE